MARKALTFVVVTFGTLALDARPAFPCGPQYDPSSDLPSCSYIDLWTPAETFPQNLEGSIRLIAYDRSGDGGLASKESFDPDARFSVHRVTPAGYEAVAFQLATQPGLVPYARQLQLADPIPGDYVVSSPDVSCAADPSPAGAGVVVGTFTIEPTVPLPTALGEITWLGQDSVTRTFELDDGNCETVEVDAHITHSTLEVKLGDDASPWRDVIDAAWYIDGELKRGYSRLDVSSAGTATIEMTRICSSTNTLVLQTQPGYGPGLHTFKLVGKIEDLTTIESPSVAFALSCGDGVDDEIGEDFADSDPTLGGCSVTNGARGKPTWLLVFLAAWYGSRRRKT